MVAAGGRFIVLVVLMTTEILSTSSPTSPGARPWKRTQVLIHNRGCRLGDISGSVYTQWGSETCSDTSTQVYSGVIGGGSWASSGSPANALCLSLSPVYDGHVPTVWSATLHGMEFETHPEAKHNQDGLCSVCRVPRSTTLMIPGTNVCPHGWILEYSGYLMGGHDTHPTSSEYICMDKKQDTRHGSHPDHNGKLYYYTIGICGSLPCPPYVHGKIITCVVCSK